MSKFKQKSDLMKPIMKISSVTSWKKTVIGGLGDYIGYIGNFYICIIFWCWSKAASIALDPLPFSDYVKSLWFLISLHRAGINESSFKFPSRLLSHWPTTQVSWTLISWPGVKRTWDWCLSSSIITPIKTVMRNGGTNDSLSWNWSTLEGDNPQKSKNHGFWRWGKLLELHTLTN